MTPTFADNSAFDKLRDVSITHDISTTALRSASSDDSLCQVPVKSLQEDVMPREHSWMHSEHEACFTASTVVSCIVQAAENSDIPSLQEEPTDAGPFPDAPTLVGKPAAPTGLSRAPNVASTRMGTPGAAGQDTIDLGVSGCDDVIPTPGFFRPGSGPAQPPIESPTTPEDAPIKPFSFSKSSGSQFATPEIPIHSGMTPVTTAADARHAQKHIPAWNRCSKLVEKSFPLVARQIRSLAAMPGPQPAWAHTPYMLLHAICTTKGWELSVRHESAPRIGVDSSVIATVNIPAINDSGRTFTSTGRNQGAVLSSCSDRQLMDIGNVFFRQSLQVCCKFVKGIRSTTFTTCRTTMQSDPIWACSRELPSHATVSCHSHSYVASDCLPPTSKP